MKVKSSIKNDVMIAKLLREKALLELYVKKIQDINKNKNNF